jgi:two-component system, chemotaxis family, chemotaxis protein CheY
MAVDKTMYILVVDNYPTMRRIIKNLLKQLGFDNVEEASDPLEGLKKLHEKPFGLVISDWGMEPSGLDFLKQVRADAQLKKLAFIMVSAESKPENVIAAKKAGVNNYIIKPLNAETLRAKIANVFDEL